MSIITEGMKYRERVVKYAIKVDNNALAARKYHTSRQNVQRWRKRYDGTTESLRKKSTRPKSHPNQHTQTELDLIKHNYRYHRHRGLAHVYRKCKDKGYTRSYDSMCRQIRKMSLNSPAKKNTRYKKEKEKPNYSYPGELVQIDVKYVPVHSIGFVSHHKRYYQITAIDAYSRTRVLDLMNENSTYTTSEFLVGLEKRMGFKIDKIQTDNGKEFTNDLYKTDEKSRFQTVLEFLRIDYRRTAPYSPWQNGLVERSHREDEERFYSKRRFTSEEELKKALARHHYERFIEILEKSKYYVLPRKVRTTFNTLMLYKDEIYYSCLYTISNGPIEGINNKIKNIKRSGYGYRNFRNFKSRILMCLKLTGDSKPKKSLYYEKTA